MDRIQLRRDSSARWAEVNPILLEGEVGFETDTNLRKIGDGVHRWNDLDYLAAENVVQEFGDSENAVVSQKAVSGIVGNIVLGGVVNLHFGSDIFAIDGRYANGNFSTGSSYNTTGILPIIPNVTIDATVYSGASTGTDMITFFDADKKFISAVKGNEDTEYNSYSGTTPEDCRYFAISTQRKDTSSFVIKSDIEGIYQIINRLNDIDAELVELSVFRDSINSLVGADYVVVDTEWVDGYIQHSDGSIILANDYYHSAPIEVKKGAQVKVVGFGQSASSAIALTNADGVTYIPLIQHTSNSVYTTYLWGATDDCYISVSKNGLSNTVISIKNTNIVEKLDELDAALNGVRRNIVPVWNIYAPLKTNTTGNTKDMLENSGYLHTEPIRVNKGDIIQIKNIFGQTATSLLSKTDEDESYYLNLIAHTTNSPSAPIDVEYIVDSDCYVTVSKNDLSACEIVIIEQEGVVDKLNKIPNFDDKGVVYLNDKAKTTEILKQASRPFGFASGTNIKQLLLLHFSDIHASEIELRRILDYAEAYKDYIDDVICTGDQVEGEYKDGMAFWNNAEADNVLQVIGNHDTLDLSAPTVTYRDYVGEPAYNQYFAPYIKNWNVVHDGNTSHCYYYKDYTQENIRLIVLDCMGYDDAENTWLSNLLSDSNESGIHVVIATHFASGEPNDIDCSFNAIGSIDLGSNNILDARVCELVKNFQLAGGKFVCYISGHTHKDKFFHPVGYPEQVCITIAEATCEMKGAIGDIARERGTRSQDLFNIISIDSYQGMIRLFRVGSDYTRLLQHRYAMCWDYNNNKLICD